MRKTDSDHEDEHEKMIMPTDPLDKNSTEAPTQQQPGDLSTVKEDSKPSIENVFQQLQNPTSESIVDQQSENLSVSIDRMEANQSQGQGRLKDDMEEIGDCTESSFPVETNRTSRSEDAVNTSNIPQAETIDDVIPSDIGTTIADPLNNRFSFPVKLHDILSKPEFQSIICWTSHGKSWLVLRPKKLEQEILRKYFRHGKFASFIRQVNGWGFKRILSGVDQNAYFHELFTRDNPRLCLTMKRKYGANERSNVLAPYPPPAGPLMAQAHLGILQTQSQNSMASFVAPNDIPLASSSQMTSSQFVARNRSDPIGDNSMQEVRLHHLQSQNNLAPTGGNVRIEDQNFLSTVQNNGDGFGSNNFNIMGRGRVSLPHNESVLPGNDPNMNARLYETRLLAVDALLNAGRAEAASLASRVNAGGSRIQPVLEASVDPLQLSISALSSGQANRGLQGSQSYSSFYALLNQLHASNGNDSGSNHPNHLSYRGLPDISQVVNMPGNLIQSLSSVAGYSAAENIQNLQNSVQGPNDRPVDQVNQISTADEDAGNNDAKNSEREE